MPEQIEYFIREKRELETNIGVGGTLKIMQDFFNELGKNGERVCYITEHPEPSQITTNRGVVNYYVLTVLTYKVTQPTTAEPEA